MVINEQEIENDALWDGQKGYVTNRVTHRRNQEI
jgi:hypothetical protein